jgi:hypothetical protein
VGSLVTFEVTTSAEDMKTQVTFIVLLQCELSHAA